MQESLHLRGCYLDEDIIEHSRLSEDLLTE